MIKIRDLYHFYENNSQIQISLRGINLDFSSNGIFLILGPNGAGKTTLLHLIKGILLPVSGTIKLDIKLNKNKFGYVDQFSYLFFSVRTNTVLSTLKLFLSKHKNYSNSIKINDHISLLGLSNVKNNKINTLSIGETQRLALLISFISTKYVMLVDEPTAQLDSESTNKVINWLKAIKSKKMVIITTHDIRLVPISNHRYVISDGYIQQSDKNFDHNKLVLNAPLISGGAIKIPNFILNRWNRPESINLTYNSEENIIQITNDDQKRKSEKVNYFPYEIYNKLEKNPKISIKNCSIVTPNNRKLKIPESIEAIGGDFVGLIGRSGSGKSSFVALLMGGLSNEFIFNGKVEITPKLEEKNIAFIQQKYPLVSFLSLKEHLNWLIPDKISIFLKIMSYFNVNVDITRKIESFSGGQMHLISLAIIFTLDPIIYVIDESLAYIDIEKKQLVLEIFKELQSLNRIILMCTHEESIIRLTSKQYFFD